VENYLPFFIACDMLSVMNKAAVDFDYMTCPEVAAQLGCSSSYLTRLCNQGRIEGAVKASSNLTAVWLIPKTSVPQIQLKRKKK
jgi:hypothetical protein